ncbi:hypothetical protein WJX72_004854 [[Myrmecia] bisecta]|uniref:RRM domain-containing protein n=1 Tax=[Myrmecia] bisecta TaxID=41462 RepID=A0AAW1PNY0_9CHLO
MARSMSRSRSRSRSPSPAPRSVSRSPRRSRSPSPDRARSDDDRRPASRSRSRSRSGPRESSANEEGTNLYISGLASRVTDDDLLKHFEQEGKVKEARIVIDPRSKEPRGFGFVQYYSNKDSDKAIKYLENTTLMGRVIHVEKAKRGRPRTPTPGQYRGVRAVRDYEPSRAPSRSYGGSYDRYGGGDRYGDRYDRDRYGGGGYGRDRYDDRPRYGYRERSRSPRYRR